jgi:LPXTG-motif cell wall-anchored protein
MTRPHLRRSAGAALTLGTAAAALLLGAPAASAADLPAPTVSKSNVAAGEDFTISGTSCVEVAEDGGVTPWVSTTGPVGVEVNSAYPANDGSWSMPISFAPDQPSGVYQVTVSCDSYDHQRPFAPVTVTVGTVPSAATSTSTSTSTPAAPIAAAPGARFVKTFSGFQPNERVHVILHSTPRDMGWFTADGNGVVTVSFTTPADLSGDHTLELSGDKGTTQSHAVRLASSAKLAYTGTDVSVPLALGGALIASGAGVLVLVRRRTRAAQA